MLDEIHYYRERARQAAARGNYDDAILALITIAQQTQISENEYVSILRPLEAAMSKRGDARSALTVQWYLSQSERSQSERSGRGIDGGLGYDLRLLQEVPHVDRARTMAAAGDVAAAGREMEEAGLVAAAAIYREKAGQWQEARALWSRLSQVLRGPRGAGGAAPERGMRNADAYHAALAQFNLARCAKQCNDAGQARDAIVAAVRLLEEAADHFESVGQRERAFDCFQVLVQIGREGGMFENILEGYVNCIRILREDHLKYFALQYFEDALSVAKEHKEYSAAATLAREAAEYARALSLHSASTYYTTVQAELWHDVAVQQIERGGPPEIAENALLAAIVSLGELGQFVRVGALYEELSRMDLEPVRKAHYARAAGRYAGVRDEMLNAAQLPSHLRQDNHVTEVWHLDLVEWEQQGSAAEACADLLLNPALPDLIRRKALLTRLTAFAVEPVPTSGAIMSDGPSDAAATNARVRLCEQLSQLQMYAVLSPLERLFTRPERQVRVAVMTAMQSLFFKRSFVTVRAGLTDPDPAVVEHAARAVESLYFPHAFDPLARIVRESSQAPIRAAALRALAHVDSREAAEFLLGILEHGAPIDRHATLEGLKRTRGARFVELARASITSSPPDVQHALREILRARGIAA
ncbi:HEAT repeat domain-containing protein [Pendulispora brunnea]|uniref:HEAT repeat domain-containing protein n=1 Tax=Pendulispora brunnea TaxID=2905690 RepID=A0ABZ2K267_9BACT